MKRHSRLVAAGVLIVAVAALSCMGKNSKVASPALKLAKKMYALFSEEMPAAAKHRATIAGEITLSKENSKQGVLSLKTSGDGPEYDKKKMCYIKYTRGEQWGVLATYDCEDKESGKKLLKRWEKKLEEAKDYKESSLIPEYEFLSMMESKLANKMARRPDFDANACIEDAASVLTDLRASYLENSCKKAPAGKELLKKMLRSANAFQYVDEDLKVDGEAVAKRFGDNSDEAKKVIKKYIKWVKKLEGDKARKALALSRGGDQTCMKWWYFDNDAAKKVYGYQEGGELCMSGSSTKERGSKYGKKSDRMGKKYGRDGRRYSPPSRERPRKAYRPSAPPPPRAAPAPEAPSAGSSASSTGIPECDDFLDKYERCIKKMPASSRSAMLSAVTRMRTSYRKAGQSAAARRSLASGCTTTQKSVAKAMARYGCKW